MEFHQESTLPSRPSTRAQLTALEQRLRTVERHLLVTQATLLVLAAAAFVEHFLR